MLRNSAVRTSVIIVGALILALAALHAYSVEGLQGYVARLFVKHWDTEYARGYSDAAFRTIRKGMTEGEVLRRLPPPLGEVWIYDSTTIGFTGEKVDHVDPRDGGHPTIRIGATKADVLKVLGSPSEKSFVYSRRPTDVSYHVRALVLRDGRVAEKIAEVYVD